MARAMTGEKRRPDGTAQRDRVALLWIAPAEFRQYIPFLANDEVEGDEPRARSRQHPVIVAPVARANDDVTVAVVGTGRALRSITLRSEASGRIDNLQIEPNKTVLKGDVLVELEDDAEQLALELAQTRLAEAKRVQDRARALMDRGVVADARITEVETAARVARLEVERAQQALRDRTVRAPFNGVLGIPLVDEGSWVDSDDDIASFDDRSVILVEFDLPQAVLPRVDVGIDVEALTSVQNARVFSGQVTAIDSRVDEQSRTARVRVAVPNPDDELRPGASFTIRLELSGPEYFVVPELALLFAREGLHVWRIKDGKAERIPVQLVRRRDGQVLVDGALEVDDQVVVEGTQRLRQGDPVNVLGTRKAGSV
jgi:RND family efflux transporter MFP subunit